eukprot:CAMPEP_0119037286 /NCGR_PEP_ID=MMETSP1177-20130426/5558_1 /TAXON_ID=2985 /ORGANISM="Ochromonas sp, Strain CCMP1899" /LENGTH=30 /DNA_ID= /DNA_START= /DNA_END= /DNA_ORIENTATION=
MDPAETLRPDGLAPDNVCPSLSSVEWLRAE